ncbi:MAG TPA: GntR family transcriptional regulator [Trueperaceae bacterium]
MDLDLDRHSPLPLHEQLTAQLRLLVDTGELRPGDPLPTIKTMASDLAVNPNTVASAYRTLENEGYLHQRKRAGTRVAQSPPRDPAGILAGRLAAEAAKRASAAGLSTSDLLRAVAAQSALVSRKPKLSVAVLAATELQARRLAAKTEAVLGDGFLCMPLTPLSYDSIDYHLTVIDPQLTSGLGGRPESAPLPTYLRYGPEFPAGAD